MPRQNKFTVAIVAIASFFILTGGVNAQTVSPPTSITGDITWTKDTPNLIFDTAIVIENGATLTIEKGTRIVFQVNPERPFNAPGFQISNGKIVANGTREENIVFTSPDDGFNFLLTDPNQESFLRHIKIENGGFVPSAAGNGDLVPQYPVFEIIGGRIHLENSQFIGSRFTEMNITDIPAQDADGNPIFDVDDNAVQNEARVTVVNSNFSYPDAVRSELQCETMWDELDNEYIDPDCLQRIYLKDDWYNHPFGPTIDWDEIEKGFHVSGFHFLDSWKTDTAITNPAIVIPGIMGSAEVSGTWKLDPILHVYDDLVASLEANGFSRDKNLFEFPYDWEKHNETSAEALQAKILAVTDKTKISKVDLVAHSMGGLVARSYIEGDAYGNDVDNLITMGTPHRGAPEAYLKWEAGEGFFTINDKLAKHHFKIEAEHRGYDNILTYIQEQIPSVRELLPDYDYLFDVAQNSLRSYSDNYPQNTFLEDLNAETNLQRLQKINITNIVGVSSEKNTISQISVVNSTVQGMWIDGMPENFYDNTLVRGIKNDYGDETVPKTSAEDIPADKLLRTDATHRELPTVAQCAVLFELTGKTACTKVTKTHIPNLLMFNVFSPIDIQIIAPDGQHWVGKNIRGLAESDLIEGAYYSGFDTEDEFVTIPNPLDGEYKIVTEGTGDGAYRIETTKISEDVSNPQVATESTATNSGTTQTGTIEEKTVTVTGDTVSNGEEVTDTEAPAIIITSPEGNKTYQNNLILPFTYSATDNVSTSDKISTQVLFDGNATTSVNVDLALQKLGKHTVKINATDEAGNMGEKEAAFTISADIDSIMANINHYSALGMLKDQKTKMILLKKTKEIKYLMAQLEKIIAIKSRHHWFVEKFISVWERQINRKIDKLIGKIQGKKGNFEDDEDDDRPDYKNNFIVAQPARDLLVESFEFIKY